MYRLPDLARLQVWTRQLRRRAIGGAMMRHWWPIDKLEWCREVVQCRTGEFPIRFPVRNQAFRANSIAAQQLRSGLPQGLAYFREKFPLNSLRNGN
jgi:hypothetical protein